MSWRSLAGLALAAGLFPLRGAASAAPPSWDLAIGEALYRQHCAACHGETGRGDGPSAVGFATKPADLTDGRLLNRLPDDYLARVIRSGGPAEGLAPTMPAFGQYLGETQIRQVLRHVRALAVPPFRPEAVKPLAAVPGAPAQPVFFSHVIHATEYRIACEYCHADARRSAYAGLPSVERCMGCHKIIGAQDNPEIAKVHDAWRRGAPIPWVRVFRLPEFTYFPHKAHVRAEVACQTCHGPIERMRVVGADTGRSLGNDLLNLVGLRPRPRPLSMGWCIDCHRARNATRAPGAAPAPLDCVACHH